MNPKEILKEFLKFIIWMLIGLITIIGLSFTQNPIIKWIIFITGTIAFILWEYAIMYDYGRKIPPNMEP